MYRPESAMDGWAKVFSFFGRYLTSWGLPRGQRVSRDVSAHEPAV